VLISGFRISLPHPHRQLRLGYSGRLEEKSEIRNPKSEFGPTPVDPKARTAQTGTTMNELILIVDDETGILTTLSQILVDEGYRTITTTSG